MGNTINIDKYVGIGFRGIIPSAIDPSAAAYFTATGITGATQQTAIDNLVKGLKADGLWSKMKAVYPFVTDNRNQAPYSDGLSSGNYQNDGTVTVTNNAAIAPDGTTTATRVVGVSTLNYIYNSQAAANNWGTGNRVLSIYLKAGTDNQVSIGITSDGSTTTTVCNLTSSWQRFEVTRNVISTGGTYNIFISGFNQSQDVFIWGIQFESGTTATTYQPIATTQQAYIASQFKYNLVNPVDSDAAFRLVFNGGWTHSSNGATPNGTNGWADTKLIPSSSLSTSSAHLSFYSRTNVNQATYDFCAGQNYSLLLYSNTFYVNLTSAGAYNATQSLTNTTGYYIGSRTNNTNVNGYRNGTKNINNFAQNSILEVTSLKLSARDGSSLFSTKQVAFSTIGDGLLDAEAAALYSHVQNFQLALNRAV